MSYHEKCTVKLKCFVLKMTSIEVSSNKKKCNGTCTVMQISHCATSTCKIISMQIFDCATSTCKRISNILYRKGCPSL